MADLQQMKRLEAIEKLRRFGIEGAQIYLIDVIPLIEMIWADGQTQDAEIEILYRFVETHVKRLNAISGCELMTVAYAQRFIARFLEKRPNPDLMKTLRSLIAPVRLNSSDSRLNDFFRDSLLTTCLDIASSCVTRYPYHLCERFNLAEKKCFFNILEALE